MTTEELLAKYGTMSLRVLCERLDVAERRVAELDAEKVRVLALPNNAPQTYVSMQHVVKLPANVCDHLGITLGGGVVFLPGKEGEALILNEAEFAKRSGMY